MVDRTSAPSFQGHGAGLDSQPLRTHWWTRPSILAGAVISGGMSSTTTGSQRSPSEMMAETTAETMAIARRSTAV